MTNYNTARIDVEGQRSKCNASMHVSRAMPAVLGDGHMSEVSWTQFCDKFDDALVPLSQLKRKLMVLGPILLLIGMVLFIVPTILVISSDNDGLSVTTFIPSIVGFVIIFVSSIISSTVTRRKTEQVRQEFTKICEEESAKDSMVSFHVRYDVHVVRSSDSLSTYKTIYIEVLVMSPEASSGASDVYDSAFASSSVGAGNGKSVEMRLSELEGLKFHLTDEEYQRKREDILASV